MANPNPKCGWKKGTSGNPAGRRKGSKDNITKMIKTAEEIASQFDLTPLEYLMTIVNNTKCGHTVRIDAAKAAAPYVHMKMPSRIDIQSPPGGGVPGGVMLVPYFTSDKEWALAASKSQDALKKDVRG